MCAARFMSCELLSSFLPILKTSGGKCRFALFAEGQQSMILCISTVKANTLPLVVQTDSQG